MTLSLLASCDTFTFAVDDAMGRLLLRQSNNRWWWSDKKESQMAKPEEGALRCFLNTKVSRGFHPILRRWDGQNPLPTRQNIWTWRMTLCISFFFSFGWNFLLHHLCKPIDEENEKERERERKRGERRKIRDLGYVKVRGRRRWTCRPVDNW